MNPAKPDPSEPSGLREERYSLQAMLAEVAVERQSGAFGMEKFHRQDIRKIFVPKPRKRRVPRR